MNDDRRFERDVASVFAETAPSRSPDDLLENVFLTTGPMRPRPRWLARIKEPPMRYTNTIAVGSPTARVAAILVATLLLIIAVAGAGIAGSRLLAADGTIVVDPSGNGTTTTITEAVAMAEDGDTIMVKPGTYDESVVITKDVTIRGDGDRETIIVELSVEIPPGKSGDAPDLPVAFLFDGSEATLENLTVRGESARIVISGGAPVLRDLVLDGIGRVYSLDPGQPTPTGLELNSGSTATIMDSLLIDMDIDIETGSSPTILGNEFSIGAIWMQGTGVDPIIRGNVIDGSVKWGISIGGGARPTVLDNTITGARTAIEILGTGWQIPDTGTNPVISGNTVIGATMTGISVGSGASATIEDNVLRDNLAGISVSAEAAIQKNRIGGGSIGISVAAGSPSLVDNVIEGASGPGIFVGGGTSPSLSGNKSCDNGENIRIVDSATPDIDDTNEICEDTPTA